MTHSHGRDSVLGWPKARPPRELPSEASRSGGHRRACNAEAALRRPRGDRLRRGRGRVWRRRGADADRRRPSVRAADLQPVKDFLLEHTERSTTDAAKLRERRRGVLRARRGRGLRLRAAARRTSAPTCKAFVEQAQETFAAANPAYEEMEGVVAGVPSLADYDVIIDAGRRQERPRERRADHAQDAGRQDVRPAGQLQLPDRDVRVRHRAEVRGQGRRARPRRRRQGRASARRCRTPTSTSPPRASSRRPRRSSTPPRASGRRRRRTRSRRSS